jgi:glycosyltransferase involved in cell wall biosynthesis
MNPSRHSWAALIPAYQAGATVADVVRGCVEIAPRVVVVNDGSTDLTATRAAEAGAEVLHHALNRGKGAALSTGFQHLFGQGMDFVLTLDADGQHLPSEMPRLFGLEGGPHDLVLGVRSHLFTGMSRVRRYSNRLSSRAISFAAGQYLSDVQTGFRLYSRRLVDAVGFPETGFEAESAVVVRACRRGFSVVVTPVELAEVDGRSTSHYRPLADSLRIARAVVGARFEHSGGS